MFTWLKNTYKNIVSNIKSHLSVNLNKFLWLLVVGGLAAFVLLLTLFPNFANIALVIFVSGIGFSLLRGWDLLFCPNLDTQTEIKNGNIAYAIQFLGAAIVVGSTIIAIFH